MEQIFSEGTIFKEVKVLEEDLTQFASRQKQLKGRSDNSVPPP